MAIVKLSSENEVISKGPLEQGFYYDFYGIGTQMSHSGVTWLTDYDNRENKNVSRIKTARLGLNKNLIIYEKWTGDRYVSSH